jgi:methionine synthase I (cobalamin-dependent)
VTQDHAAIVLTSTARSAFQSAGTNADMLMTEITVHITELKRIYTQFIALHPNSGGDSANETALLAILAKL